MASVTSLLDIHELSSLPLIISPTSTTLSSSTIVGSTPSSSPGSMISQKRGTAPGVIAVIVFVSMMMVIIPWFVWRRRMARLGFEWNMRPRPSRRDIYASTLSTHPAFMEPYPVASPGGYRRSSRGAPLAPLPSLTTTYSWSSEKHLSDEGGGVPECPICYEDMTGRTTVGAPCGHLLCRSCRELVVDTAARNGERAKCHACRAPYT